jgi:hypothetical protein
MLKSNTVQDFEWITLPPGPTRRLDAGAIQIGRSLFCWGGYESQDHVLSVVDRFDLDRCEWAERMPMPTEVPQSHFALAGDGERYIYAASGQVGPRCCHAVAATFAFDILEHKWHSLPSLPEARYAATMQLWRGRLHIVGGAKPDRYTPASEHWSLGVRNGHTTEKCWRVETPIPRGGMHRASAVVDDRFFVLGGQEGDFIAIPGDPDYSCTGETVEHIYADVYQWNPVDSGWMRLPDMPVPSSHIDFSVVVADHLIFLVGGSRFKDPITFEIELTDVVQVYDTRARTWALAGHLPFRVKTCMTALYDGWLYMSAGQRDRGPDDPRPGAIENGMWRARLIN